MPFRRHFARKELREHQIAQMALQRGDIKEWHKHEAKAHRAGRHARSGLLHTEYTSFKENIPPMTAPVPYQYPPAPLPIEEPIPVMAPMMPITSSTRSLSMPQMMSPPPVIVEEGGMFDDRFAPNTIVEVGGEMEADVILEPTLIEEPTTLIEYGDPMAPVTYIDELAQIEAYMDSAAVAGYTEVMTGPPIPVAGGENVVYGEPQFVDETVVTTL